MSCGNPHETDCREVLDRVYEYLDGEMTEHDIAKVKQHLEECSPCLSEYDLDVVLKALVRAGLRRRGGGFLHHLLHTNGVGLVLPTVVSRTIVTDFEEITHSSSQYLITQLASYHHWL